MHAITAVLPDQLPRMTVADVMDFVTAKDLPRPKLPKPQRQASAFARHGASAVLSCTS